MSITARSFAFLFLVSSAALLLSNCFAFEKQGVSANALKAQQTLLNCKLATDDKRQLLGAIDKGLVSQVAHAKAQDCAPGVDQNLNGFLKNFKALAASETKKKDQGDKARIQSFIKALRLQTLQSALITYLDAELRYNLNAPGPQPLLKVKTAARKFCETKSGTLSCDAGELKALEKTVSDYQKEFHQNNIQTLTPLEAKFELNQKLNLLNQAYQPVKDQTRVWQASHLMQSKPGIEAQDGIAQTLSETSSRFKATTYQLTVAPARRKYLDQFLQETQGGVGILLYSKTMREKIPSQNLQAVREVRDVEVVKSAINEVKNETLALAQTTNELTVEFLQNQDEKVQHRKTVTRTTLTALMPVSALFTRSLTDFRGALKTMLKTNPLAAGQVLAAHPEFAEDVCSVGLEIQADDLRDEHLHQTLQVATYGSMIIGGVLVGTGFLAPAGIALNAGAMAAITTLQAVNTGLGYALLVGNTGYTVHRQFDLHDEIRENQQSLLARTGGNVQRLRTNEKEYDDAGKALAKTLAMTILPMGAAKLTKFALASEVMKDSKVVESFQNLYSQYQSNLMATSSVRALDYFCARMHESFCNYTLSALNSLSTAQQQLLLENPEAFKAFAKNAARESGSSNQAE